MKYMANCCNKLKQEILISLFHITDDNVKSELGLYILGLGTIENAYVKLELVNLKFMTTAQHASSQIIKSWAEVLEYRAFGLFSSIKQRFLVKNFEQNQIHSRRLKDFCQIDDVFDRILLSLST